MPRVESRGTHALPFPPVDPGRGEGVATDTTG